MYCKRGYLVTLLFIAAIPFHAARGTDMEEIKVTGQAVSGPSLDAVSTTASRMGLKILEIPASVDMIDREAMKTRGHKQMSEAVDSLPGTASGEPPGDPSSFSMRGFTDNQVTILRDGIRAGPASMAIRPQNTFNLARIEILKGPASVLSGEGAIGGTINLITKQPVQEDTNTVEGQLSFGRFSTFDIGLGSGGPLGDSVWYRADISYYETGHFVDRAGAESLNITTSLLWQPVQNLELKFSIDYQDDELPVYWGTPLVPAGFAENPMISVAVTNDGRTVDRRMRFVNFNVEDFNAEAQQVWLRGSLKWHPSEHMTVRNVAYYYSADRDWQNAENYVFNTETGLIDRDRFFVTHEHELYGNQFDFLIEYDIGGFDNRFLAGFDYSHLDFVRGRGFPDGDSVDPFNPLPGNFGPRIERLSPTRMDTASLFLEDVLELTDKTTIVAGFRYDNIDLVRENFDPAGNFIDSQSFRRTFDVFSWRTGIVYKLTPAVVGYAQWSTGEDPAGSNLFLVNAGQNFNLSESRQWEAGFKADLLQGHAELTVAYYDIKREDILTQINSAGDLANIGSHESSGIEISGAWRITEKWRLGGNTAWTDANFGMFVDPNFSIDATGNRPANVAKWTANIWSSYRNPAELPMEVGAGFRYVGDRFGNHGNTLLLKSYILADVYASYDIKPVRITVRVHNLFDTEYSPWADVFNPSQILLGSPRSYELGLEFSF